MMHNSSENNKLYFNKIKNNTIIAYFAYLCIFFNILHIIYSYIIKYPFSSNVSLKRFNVSADIIRILCVDFICDPRCIVKLSSISYNNMFEIVNPLETIPIGEFLKILLTLKDYYWIK